MTSKRVIRSFEIIVRCQLDFVWKGNRFKTKGLLDKTRKEAFERLIKERGVCVVVGFFYHFKFVVVADNIEVFFFWSMVFTATDNRKHGLNDVIIKTISSRQAERREPNTEPSRVRSIILFLMPGSI